MKALDGRISNSAESLRGIVEAINGFTTRIEDQNRLIGDSVAAVTQILSSISNINRIVNQDKEAAEKLVQIADQGKGVFDSAFNAISERIKEMSNSIAEIYSNVSEMQLGSRQVLETMESLRSGSKEITDITGSVDDIPSRSDKIAEAGATLEAAVSRFMISEGEVLA
jgi:methyl-accepting chemotaxis protein